MHHLDIKLLASLQLPGLVHVNTNVSFIGIILIFLSVVLYT